MSKQKSPKDMTLDELIEFRRDYKMSEQEREDQVIAIAVAESNHSSGDYSSTPEMMRAIRDMDKKTSKETLNSDLIDA